MESGSVALRYSRTWLRWARNEDFEAGTYRFTVTGGEGIRVLVDGNSIING